MLRLRGLLRRRGAEQTRISRLRRNIDKGRAPMIHTVRGLGYAIRAEEDGR